MKSQFATGFIPYEIGDTVQFKDGEIFDIIDIRMIQYIKVPKVEFEVQITGEYWVSSILIEKRIIK